MPSHDRNVPNQPRTPARGVRVPDELWHAAQEIARAQGETISDVIRDCLAEYVARHSQDSVKPEG